MKSENTKTKEKIMNKKTTFQLIVAFIAVMIISMAVLATNYVYIYHDEWLAGTSAVASVVSIATLVVAVELASEYKEE